VAFSDADLRTLVPVDTHEDRLRAIEAYPTALRYAAEDNPFYQGLVFETHVAFAFWLASPWRWLT
jgi:hypothetical protein